jgi:hypothetical protein
MLATRNVKEDEPEFRELIKEVPRISDEIMRIAKKLVESDEPE